MPYCFRIRFNLGDNVKIDSTASELRFDSGVFGETVTLRPAEADVTIGEARKLALRGESYVSAADAHSAVTRWQAALQSALARLNVGADFGSRAPAGGEWTDHGLAWLSEQFGGQRVLPDVHGVTVFECDPPPLFVSQSLSVIVGKPDRLVQMVNTALHLAVSMTDQQQLAYDLYGGSFFQRDADARFVMLAMALETLIGQNKRQMRTPEALAHVKSLIEATKASNLPKDQILSLQGGLGQLCQEPVGGAGKQLVQSLGDRRYMDESPSEFFTHCYRLRSKLVHGKYPRPTREEVGLRAASLELFVGHLLCGVLLDVVPEWTPDESP